MSPKTPFRPIVALITNTSLKNLTLSHQASLDHLVTTTKQTGLPFVLASPDQTTHFPSPSINFFPLKGADLGVRQLNLTAQLFSKGHTSVTLIHLLATQLNQFNLTEAITALDHSDLVIGPHANGTSYLLSQKTLYPRIFLGKPWGTPGLTRELVSTADSLSLRTHFLPRMFDPTQLIRLQSTVTSSPAQPMHLYTSYHPSFSPTTSLPKPTYCPLG